MTYADHVRAYEKSVVLGGAKVLFPVEPSLTQGFARQIQAAIREAEAMAYQRGVEDTKRAMRSLMGLK